MPPKTKREYNKDYNNEHKRIDRAVKAGKLTKKEEKAARVLTSMKHHPGPKYMSRAFSTDEKYQKEQKPPGMKHGGIVKATGPTLLHKGEVVIPAHALKR